MSDADRRKPRRIVRCSKSMSRILRHKAVAMGLSIRPDGFVKVVDVLGLPAMRNFSRADIDQVVATCDKKRFSIVTESGVDFIRCNQGHTIKSVKAELLLHAVTRADEIPECVHGTNWGAWKFIKTQGLHRMQRNHIHFAKGLFGDPGVVSGMRWSAGVAVYIDTKAAMQAGIKFFISENGVILSSGVDGTIPPCFFSKVIDAKTRAAVPFVRPPIPTAGDASRGAVSPVFGPPTPPTHDVAAAAPTPATAAPAAIAPVAPAPPGVAACARAGCAPVAPATAVAGASPQEQRSKAQKRRARRRNVGVASGVSGVTVVKSKPRQHAGTTTPTPTAAGAVAVAGAGAPRAAERTPACHMKCGARYVVVLDFEATCQREGRINPQEIIEFPSVVLDTSTMKVVDMFQEYIKPVHHPVLSEFCTELTGITQATVDAGRPFGDVLVAYDAWMRRKGYADSCLMVTCGDWDLKTMLPAQLETSGITDCPEYLTKWMNIKHVFPRVTGQKAFGMAGMLRSLDMELEGRHHSGIDDCRNICRIAMRLLAMPAGPDRFKVTRKRGGGGQGRRGKGRGGAGRGRGRSHRGRR